MEIPDGSPDKDLAEQLRALTDTAEGDLLASVYTQLRRTARALLRKERPGQTLQATALVHEAWLRLAPQASTGWDNQRHFFAAATEAMRRTLIDRARRRNAAKRGGDLERIDLDELAIPFATCAQDVVDLDDTLLQLEGIDPRLRELVNLRYFGGFSVRETAEVLGTSEATVTRDWRFVRSWLERTLGSDRSLPGPD